MGTDCVPIDPAERDLAAAQLEDMALAYAGKPWTAWKDVVLRWHIDAMASARSQAWIPGMAGPGDPVVEQTLTRFYLHHMRLTISQLRGENLDLQRKLADATACARFYATGANDGGQRAQLTLATPRSGAAGRVGQSH